MHRIPLFTNFMGAVIRGCAEFHTEKLRGFKEMLMAVFLFHLDEFCNRYGSNHIVVQEFVRKGNGFGYGMKSFTEFGRVIREDYNERNIHACIPENFTENDQQLYEKMEKCERIVQHNLDKVPDMSLFLKKDIVSRMQRMEEDNVSIHKKLDEILAILRQQQASVNIMYRNFMCTYV